MREIEWSEEDEDEINDAYDQYAVDWKSPPGDVLEQVDSALEEHGLEVVRIDTGDDSVVFAIAKREESE